MPAFLIFRQFHERFEVITNFVDARNAKRTIICLTGSFDLANSKGLGMRFVRAFVQQLEAMVAINPQPRGIEFVLLVPLEPKP